MLLLALHLCGMLETIKDLYKFYITHPIDGLIEVFPANAKIEWNWKRQKEQIFFRKELSTELNFIGEDFKKLYKLDRSNYRCEKILIDIHRKCDDAFTSFWTGYLALIDGDFDADRCKVKIKPRIEDDYTCLLSNWNKEKDFISGIGAPESVGDVKFITGTIEEDSCLKTIITPELIEEGYYPIDDSCIEDPSLWAFYQMVVENTYFNNITSQYELLVRYIFRREKIISSDTPNGVGWVNIGTSGSNTIWVRPYSGVYNTATISPIKNGRKLNDVIQYLLDDCGLTYVSDFFGINGDNTSPINFAYDYANDFYKELVIWQKSDVKRQPRVITDSIGNTITLPFQNATKANVKLKDLILWLENMYNVKWFISGNTFRIEHYTYFRQNQNRIDLTTNNRIKGLNKYKYINEDLPLSETWSWMETSDTDFDGLPIFYNDVCSYSEDDANENEKPINKITTNVEYIALNPSKIADEGFVIASTNQGSLQSDVCRISTQSKINGSNALCNLIYYLHRHGRTHRQGNINGSDEALFLTLPIRSQEGISVPICCTDVAIFDPLHKVRTQLGWGYVDSAKLSDPTQILTLNLLHD